MVPSPNRSNKKINCAAPGFLKGVLQGLRGSSGDTIRVLKHQLLNGEVPQLTVHGVNAAAIGSLGFMVFFGV